MPERVGAPKRNGGLHIRNMQDFVGGLVLFGVALFALAAASDLAGMHDISFGPGTAPRLFALLLGIVGLGICAMSVFVDGPPQPVYAFRGPALVTASILLFAVMIRPLGLVAASFVMFMFAASGSNETRWIEAAVVGALLTAGCVVLFHNLLNLPFELWPRFTVFGVTIAF